MGIQGRKDATQLGHDARLLWYEQQFILTGAGRVNVHGREYTALGNATVQFQLGIAGALEFLEDDGIAGRTGLHHGGGDDCQRAALFDIAGGAEEALWRVERVGVHTAREDAAGCRGGIIVGAAQAGNGVEQNNDVLALLHKALGTLDSQLGYGGVL